MSFFLSILLLLSSIISSIWFVLQALYFSSKKIVEIGYDRNKKISIIIAIKDEEVDTIRDLIRNLSELDYDNYEVIIVSDDKQEIFEKYLSIPYPKNFKIVRREVPTGRKAGALNFGVNLSSGDFLVFLDAEARVDKDFLKHVSYLLKYNVISLRLKVRNAQGIGRIYSYFTDFSMSSLFRGRFMRGLYIFPNGSAFAIKKSILVNIGGWKENVVTEDLELGIRLALNNIRIYYFDEPSISILSPLNYYDLYMQIKRWAYGSGELFLDGLKLIKKGIKGLEGFLYVIQWGVYSLFLSIIILLSLLPYSINVYIFIISIIIYGFSLLIYSSKNPKEADLSGIIVVFAAMIGFIQGFFRVKFSWRVTPKIHSDNLTPNSVEILRYIFFIISIFDILLNKYSFFLIMFLLSITMFEL
ncbi:glycosyltransferase family 2 protein [Acidianus brierleyi]|uniref:glycosyltransferase family 2 protein n=1 Tax=Acidianus brierleyi TaxID=41673 RepID=UPI00144382BD|nr:glycosyltransferase family 2 protein [Acidianus brierleyi]AWR93335.2 glycosyltransferase [Acidianus brierleyi]